MSSQMSQHTPRKDGTSVPKLPKIQSKKVGISISNCVYIYLVGVYRNTFLAQVFLKPKIAQESCCVVIFIYPNFT